MRTGSLVLVPVALALASCGSADEEQVRTVKSYEFSSCDSTPTTDAKELAALKAFSAEVRSRYFTRQDGSLFVSNREESPAASGVREYEGPFHLYLHPRKLERQEQAQGVEWAATAYLHAARVRSRTNGAEWTEWERVRTRNFFEDGGRTTEGMGRWKCLVNAEIAWADVLLKNGAWKVTPSGISVYGADELERLLPTPSPAQIEGDATVPPLSLPNAVSDRTSA
jgi:hypothetical protein